MSLKVDGIGGNLPPTPSIFFTQITTDQVQANTTSEKKVDINEVSPISPSYKDLFLGFRNATSEIIGLRKFISWFSKDSKGAYIERVNDAFNPSTNDKDALEDLRKSFSEKGIDLTFVLTNLLIKDNSFEEKVQIIKMLLALEKEEELYNHFLIPALGLKADFESLKNNHEFCCKLLTLLSTQNLRKILNSIDYNQIGNINEFANSLAKNIDGEVLLEELIKIINSFQIEDFSYADIQIKQGNLQKLAVSTLKKLLEHQLPIKIEIIENLHKATTSLDVNKELCETIKANLLHEAPKIFKEQLFDKSDLSDNARLRRSYAINYFSQIAGGYGTKTLKEFIEKEEDPFLVFQAIFLLANKCDLDGKRAILSTIVNQIRENKVSLPLAALTMLLKEGEPYLDILKNLFIRSFATKDCTNGCNLREAYLKLMKVEYGNIFRNKSNVLIFELCNEPKPDLVISLVSNIGLENILKWATGQTQEYEIENNNLRKNVFDILELAWETNPSKMRELAIGSTALGDIKVLNLFTKLAGLNEATKIF